MQDRFDLRFPAAAALPTSNRPSRCQPGSAERLRPQARAGANRRKAAALRRRQWGARKEKQGPYDDHPRKPHPRLQLRGSTSQFCLCRAHPVQTCKSGTHRLARPVSLFGKVRGPHENPAKRFSWGEEKETERCETCPSGRGEYRAASFDDNGGVDSCHRAPGANFYSLPCSRSASTVSGRPHRLMKPVALVWS